jgi:hypothetical protein
VSTFLSLYLSLSFSFPFPLVFLVKLLFSFSSSFLFFFLFFHRPFKGRRGRRAGQRWCTRPKAATPRAQQRRSRQHKQQRRRRLVPAFSRTLCLSEWLSDNPLISLSFFFFFFFERQGVRSARHAVAVAQEKPPYLRPGPSQAREECQDDVVRRRRRGRLGQRRRRVS